MKIISTSSASLSTMSTLEQLALYSGMDNLSVLEIAPILSAELTPTKQSTYLFEMDLQSALLEMSFNGIHIDPSERLRLTSEYEAEQQRIAEYLHQFCEAIGYYDYYLTIARIRYADAIGVNSAELPSSWGGWLELDLQTRRDWKSRDEKRTELFHKALKEFAQPFNANSPSQKLRLFYHFFGSPRNQICTEQYSDAPPPWGLTRGITEYKTRNQDGEYTPSADRDCLEKILALGSDDERDAAYWARPFIQCCLAIADYTKALGFLRCKLENGIFRSSFGSVTETGRLNSKKNAQGYGSNAQNVDPRLRSVFTCPMGWKMATPDYEQIESRIVGAICYRLFGATRYINASECGDLHTLVCSMVWEHLGWPEEFTLDYLEKYGPPFPKDMIAAAKKLAKKELYRGKTMRDGSKTLGHGSNYYGKPPTMAKHSHIPQPLVEHYQKVYFERFPELPRWHLWVIEQVQRYGEITTMLGRTRQFFGRPSDDATIREAIAFEPQSVAADYTNKALLQLHRQSLYSHRDLPITIFLQKHDELGFRYLEKDEDTVLPKVREAMVQNIELVSPAGITRQWNVPVELQSGWNLGKYYNPESEPDPAKRKHPNLDGTREWKGPDERTRQRNPFSIGGIIL